METASWAGHQIPPYITITAEHNALTHNLRNSHQV